METKPGEKDIVLIYYEDKPLSFARIEAIEPDHKPGWYHVSLLLLQVPVQAVTWILRDAYIDGAEFTMNGKRMRLEKVISPHKAAVAEPPAAAKAPARDPNGAKVISFADIKKDKYPPLGGRGRAGGNADGKVTRGPSSAEEALCEEAQAPCGLIPS